MVLSAFDGFAELVAIAYRAHWRDLQLTPPDRWVADDLRFNVQPVPTVTDASERIAGLVRARDASFAQDSTAKLLKKRTLHELSTDALNVARFAAGQLSSARASSGTEAREIDAGLTVLSNALEQSQDFQRIQSEYQAAVARGLEEPLFEAPFTASTLLSNVRKARTEAAHADAEFFAAFNDTSLRLLNGRSSPPPLLRNFRQSSGYENEITTTAASVEVNRSALELRSIVDPRSWHVNMPTFWPQETGFTSQIPPDRSQDPQVSVAATPPFGQFGFFFEVAQIDFGFLPFAKYRNVLDLRIQHDDPNTGAFEFNYDQNTCLTSEFWGASLDVGGIDVDHGYGRVEQLADGWSRLSAAKTIRFSLPEAPGIRHLYNDSAAVVLPIAIASAVLYGACAQPAPTP